MTQASLELTILLPQPLECWDYGMNHTKSFVSSPWVTFNIWRVGGAHYYQEGECPRGH